MHTACVFGSIRKRNCLSEKRRRAIGWPFSQGLLFAMVLFALLSALSGCGPAQTDVGQTNGNNVPVNLNISMPQESAAASTRGSRFWATVQSWLPGLTSAWAATTNDLRALTVQVTGPGILSPITKTEELSNPQSGNVIPITLDVPAGPERVFTVFGLDGAGLKIFQGESTSTTLTVGQAATVDIDLRNTSVTITTASLPSGTTTQNYRATVAASGGTPPYTWSIVGGFAPAPGLSLSPSGTTAGQITGTPTTAGAFTQTYRVQDSTGAADIKSLTLTVNTQLTIDTTTLPNGTALQPNYSATVVASGGVPPYSWSIVGGLPPAPGLSLSPSGATAGQITGTPTTAGTFTQTYRVQDSSGAAVTKSLTLTVETSPVITSQGSGVLRGTFLFDLDNGTESITGDGGLRFDIWWEQITDVARQMALWSGSARIVNLGVVDFNSITAESLKTLPYGTKPIPGNNDATNQLVTGDVFAVRTNQGNYAKVLVVNYGYNLSIRWITYSMIEPGA